MTARDAAIAHLGLWMTGVGELPAGASSNPTTPTRRASGTVLRHALQKSSWATGVSRRQLDDADFRS